jgi:hypothetical protein
MLIFSLMKVLPWWLPPKQIPPFHPATPDLSSTQQTQQKKNPETENGDTDNEANGKHERFPRKEEVRKSGVLGERHRASQLEIRSYEKDKA